eukprot:4095415-Prymnesium_polylepis.2
MLDRPKSGRSSKSRAGRPRALQLTAVACTVPDLVPCEPNTRHAHRGRGSHVSTRFQLHVRQPPPPSFRFSPSLHVTLAAKAVAIWAAAVEPEEDIRAVLSGPRERHVRDAIAVLDEMNV